MPGFGGFVEPFTGAHIGAIAQAGDFPNLMEGYAKGEEMGRNRLRQQAQQEASAMFAKGDKAGGINRLLGAGAIEPMQYLNYQQQEEATAHSREREGVMDRRYEQERMTQERHWGEEQRIREEQLDSDLMREYKVLRATKQIPPEMSYFDFVAQRSGKPTPSQIMQFFQGQGNGAGVLPGPRASDYQPPAPNAPAASPGAPGVPMGPQAIQGPNADMPQSVPGTPMGPPPQTTQGQVRQAQVGPVVNPQPQSGTQPNNPYGFPNELWTQAQGSLALDPSGDMAMDILKKNQREEGAPREFTMEQGMAKEWADLQKDFMSRASGYQDFNAAFEAAFDKNNPNAGAAHVAALYGFAKVIDPIGAVREGDADFIQRAAGLLQQLQNTYGKGVEGRLLPDAALLGMKQQADARFAEAFKRYQTAELQQRGVASGRGLNPYNAVPDLTSGVRPQKRRSYDESLPPPPRYSKSKGGRYTGSPRAEPAGDGISDFLWKLWPGR